MRQTKKAKTTAPQQVQASTVGEELYLVHLRRQAGRPPNEDDFDHEEPRQRSCSIGEALWGVHLKRSAGLEPDYDDETKAFMHAKDGQELISVKRKLGLRNREVEIVEDQAVDNRAAGQ